MPAPSWTYTYGSTTALHRTRLLVGDNRGATDTGVGFLFSDEELADLLILTGSDVRSAAAIALQCRANREAMAAGVAGTTDTTERPDTLMSAARETARCPYPTSALSMPDRTTSTDNDF